MQNAPNLTGKKDNIAPVCEKTPALDSTDCRRAASCGDAKVLNLTNECTLGFKAAMNKLS